MTKSEVLAYLSAHKAEFGERFGVMKIGLFGSYARDCASENSDIDIAVEMDAEHKTLSSFLGLKRTLEAALGKAVDLGIESTLKPAAKKMVENEIIYV